MLQSLPDLPPGLVVPFAGLAIPDGWLECTGQAVSRTEYSTLFSVLGTTWGAGDGSTTFNLPDLRGRCAIGAGQGSGLSDRALGATGGAETHSLSIGEMPSHSHGPGGSATSYICAGDPSNAPVGAGATNWGTQASTGSSGGDGSHNNMPPWAALTFIIKA